MKGREKCINVKHLAVLVGNFPKMYIWVNVSANELVRRTKRYNEKKLQNENGQTYAMPVGLN